MSNKENINAHSFQFTKSRNLPYQNLNFKDSYKWIMYDYDNLYPQKLITFLDSAVHGAIIKSKTNYTIGKGLIWDKEDDTLNNFLNNINHEYGVNELMKRSAYDLIVFGGFAWEIKWNMFGDKIVSIRHVDYSKVRVENPNNKGYTDGYYLSSDWSKGQHQYNQYQPYNPFLVNKFDEVCREPQEACLYTFIEYNSIVDFYAVPDYHGILNYLQIDLEIANYHLSNIKNNMLPATLISMPFEADDEYRNEFEVAMAQKFSGSDNAGKAMVLWANTQNTDGSPIFPEITQFENASNYEVFKYLQDTTTQQIISGHRLNSPTLAGLSGNGGLGGNGSEISTALEMFINTIIKGYQNTLLDSLKKMLNINGYSQKIDFGFNMPISFIFSEAILPQIMTINEMRKATGLEPIVGGDTLQSKQMFRSQNKTKKVNPNQLNLI